MLIYIYLNNIINLISDDIYHYFDIIDMAFIRLDWLRWRARAAVDVVVAAAICVAGAALRNIYYPFVW